MKRLLLSLSKGFCFAAVALLSSPMSFGQTDGWTDYEPVESNGTRNSTDPGSRIAYIDASAGNNSTGQYYWWNGSQIVDSSGTGYGSDPMNPTGSIQPFASITASGAPEYRGNPLYNQTHYPDWILFKRGQNHSFSSNSARQAGRSPEEPAVLGAYGSLSLNRPHLQGEFRICNCGDPEVTNLVVLSVRLGTTSTDGVTLLMDVPSPPYYYGDREDSRSWFWFEDVLIDNTKYGFALSGVADVTIYRSIVTNVWNASAHNQGLYVGGPEINLTVDDSIYYRNGMKSDPVTDSTPGRDIFSRNFYLGGGEHLGVHFKNVISANGGSGGPQVRYGGIVESSLIIEGYWFTSTDSNGTAAPWLDDNMETFEFRNNVQLVFQMPVPGSPSDPSINANAQPGAGFTISMASSGVFEDNIISGVLLDELGFSSAVNTSGIEINLNTVTNSNGTISSNGNVIQDNIMYRVAGLYANGTNTIWSGIGTQQFVNNQWYDRGSNYALSSAGAISTFGGLLEVDGNTFYSDQSGVVNGGTLSSWKSADMGTNQFLARNQATWSDPGRSLKTYADEVLGLTVTSASGMDEFFAVATAMRKGEWDEEYTAVAVVDYIRDGFDLPPVGSGGSSISVTGVDLSPASVSLSVSQTSQLAATVSPSNATNQSVTWGSNNSGVATVSSSGLVTAVSPGSATITVTTVDGSYTDTCAVTVSGVDTNVAEEKDVTASAWQDDSFSYQPPEYLVDGDTSDPARWSALNFPQWAVIDLGDIYDISEFRLYPYQSRDYEYTIETSVNGTSYTTEVDRSSNTESNTVFTDSANVTARYVRLTVTGGYTYSGSWISINELEVFGSVVQYPVGSISRDYWTGISGGTVSNLTGHANYPNTPTGTDTLSSLQAVDWNNSSNNSTWANNYGQRIYGYLVPPTTGYYTFWISSDDSSELYLSTDSSPSNASLIAYMSSWTSFLEWDQDASQKSAAIYLVANQGYYIEVIHKEGGGDDHVSVGWAKPGESTSAPSEIVPGSAIAPW